MKHKFVYAFMMHILYYILAYIQNNGHVLLENYRFCS